MSKDSLIKKLWIAENALIRIQSDAEYCYGKPFDWTARLGVIAKEAIAAMGEAIGGKPQYGIDALAGFAQADKQIPEQPEAAHGYGCPVQADDDRSSPAYYTEKDLTTAHDCGFNAGVMVTEARYKQPEPVMRQVMGEPLEESTSAEATGAKVTQSPSPAKTDQPVQELRAKHHLSNLEQMSDAAFYASLMVGGSNPTEASLLQCLCLEAAKRLKRESGCDPIVRQAQYWAKGYIDQARKGMTGLEPTENNIVDRAIKHLTDIEDGEL